METTTVDTTVHGTPEFDGASVYKNWGESSNPEHSADLLAADVNVTGRTNPSEILKDAKD